MSKITGKENPIHNSRHSTDSYKHNIYFLETTDDHHQFLLTLYKSVIGQHAYPLVHQPRLIIHLENLVDVFDWAWLQFSDFQKFSPHGKVLSIINPSLPSFTDYSIDKADSTLHFSRWIPERRKLYHGNIRVLSQIDIYSINSFFYKLFEHKTLRRWKETLIQWQQYALDPALSLTDSGICTAYEAYMDYEFLQKLGEVTWLSLKQDEKLKLLDMHPWFHADNYPAFISMESDGNPYQYIYNFFQDPSFSKRKENINYWLKSALDESSIWEGQVPDLLWMYREIGELIESCWIIRELGPNYPEEWNNHLWLIRTERPPEEELFTLDEEFIEKPENYLNVFFEKISLNECRHQLFECLYSALGSAGFPLYSKDEIQKLHKDLLLLTEAAFLIQKMKFKKH